MTKVLAQLLGAEQPRFGITIRELERAAGKPSTDIKLSSELSQRALRKIKELGLDPYDTTEKELYTVLLEKVKNDEAALRKSLGISDSATSLEIIQTVVQHVESLPVEYQSFALKTSVAKRLIKKYPPKRAMKQLNYRSLDSFLKHEDISHVFVAAFLCESLSWRTKFVDQFNKLQPTDFESRAINVSIPQANRWKTLSSKVTTLQRHNVILVKELGAVVVLPIDQQVPGLTIATMLLVLNAQNDIASAGTFLKLQQVKPDFGRIVQHVTEREPMTSSQLMGQNVPWRVVHQYYARNESGYNNMIFEPHVQPSDLQWYHSENVLTNLHQNLEFWHDTRYTAFVHQGKIVSLNLLDAVLNYCNTLPLADRMQDFMRQSLWQELMVRYLNHSNVEQAIANELSPQLAFAEAES